MKKNIIQICPTFPPNTGGVGNYTKLLADFLKKKKINSKILVSDHLDNKNKKQTLFGKKNKNLISLLEKINSNVVILHFSGYGYATRGLCFNLIKSLEKWKQINKNRTLITIFHEIYATGPIYRMSYWTSLLNLSNVALATSKHNNIILSSFEKKKKIIYSNIFSTIGEIKKNKKLNTRKNIAIIFGNTYQKQILYKDILIKHKTEYASYRNRKVLKNQSFLVLLQRHVNGPFPTFFQKHDYFIGFSSYSRVGDIERNAAPKPFLHIHVSLVI